MLKDRVSLLLETLHISNARVARYAGIAPSGVSFLRTGKRKPGRDSSTAVRFVDAVVRIVEEEGQEEELQRLLDDAVKGTENRTEKGTESRDFRQGLMNWLYSGATEEPFSLRKSSGFGERLEALMRISGIRNSTLAKLIHTDPSAISRLKKGTASPDSGILLADDICLSLSDRLVRNGSVREALSLMELPLPEGKEPDRDELMLLIKDWLLLSVPGNGKGMERLLSGISSFQPRVTTRLPSFEEAVLEGEMGLENLKSYYCGIEGFREAVIRFLTDAVQKGGREFLLYSDQDMDWLSADQDFRKRWIVLMTECLKRGIRIRIIHNLDRNPDEMADAIVEWLPLYMSGLVEPWYCRRRKGGRFSHTLFLCPETGSISAWQPAGREKTGFCRYDTEPELLKIQKGLFESMLSDCGQLLIVRPGQQELPGEELVFPEESFTGIGIRITDNAVRVVKTDEPRAVFLFLHPLMRAAFRDYLSRVGK